MKKIFQIVFLFLSQLALTQNADSALHLLKNLPPLNIDDVNDTIRCNLLNYIVENGEYGVWEKYNEELYKITEHRVKITNSGTQLNNKYKTQLAAAINNTGLSYNERGDINKALSLYHQSIRLLEEAGDKENAAVALLNIGMLYYETGQRDKALEYCLKSLRFLEGTNRARELATAAYNIGTIYIESRNFSEALHYLEKSLLLSKSINYELLIAGVTESKGFVFKEQNKITEALNSFNQSLKKYEQLNLKANIANVLANICNCYIKINDNQNALKYALVAHEAAKQAGTLEAIRHSASQLRDVYEKMGKYREALEYYKLTNKLNDSTKNETLKREVMKKELEFEFEKKEIVLKQQQLKLTELNHQKKKFYAIVTGISILFLTVVFFLLYRRYKYKKEKENQALQLQVKDAEITALQAQMNPHFIFNSLNSIMEFINKSEKEEALKYLTKFSRLIRSVLEYSSKKTISLTSELEFIQTYIELENIRFGNSINYSLIVGEDLDKDNIEVPALLIQPLVENAIVHGIVNKQKLSHENKSTYNAFLQITINRVNNHLECIVEDNGIGREKAKEIKEKKIFEHQSMGMRITKQRLELLGKTNLEIVFDDLKDNNGNASGTRVEILIPLIERF